VIARLLIPVILPKINAEIFIVMPLNKICSKICVKKFIDPIKW
jgi:hypothetical protein